MHFKHILVTTDFSEISKAAFDFAGYQAKMEGSKVTLLHVLEQFVVPPELSRVVWNPESLRKMEEEYIANATTHLQELASSSFHGQKVEAAVYVSSSGAANGVCKYARTHEVDLIVMSGHGRGALKTALLGSVVQGVLHKAHCPVLVVRRDRAENES